MNLIEEIEEAAKPKYGRGDRYQEGYLPANQIISTHWWERIKAALEAAQAMDDLLTRKNWHGIDDSCQAKFREAMK